MPQENNSNNRLLLYVALGGLLVMLIVVILFASLRNRTALDIKSIIPDDINVTVDGKKVKSNANVGVNPGKHTVEAKREGFVDKKIEVDLKKNEVRKIDLSLLPKNAVGYTWLQENKNAVRDLEAKTGQAYDDAAQQGVKANPLIQYLPMLRRDWRIDYGASQKEPTNPKAVSIIITYVTEGSKQNALTWIRDQGFDPKDYEIIYKQMP